MTTSTAPSATNGALVEGGADDGSIRSVLAAVAATPDAIVGADRITRPLPPTRQPTSP